MFLVSPAYSISSFDLQFRTTELKYESRLANQKATEHTYDDPAIQQFIYPFVS